MGNKKILQVKKVKTETSCVTRKESIKVTQKHIDELNQKMRDGIAENEIRREKGYEIAEKCVMK